MLLDLVFVGERGGGGVLRAYLDLNSRYHCGLKPMKDMPTRVLSIRLEVRVSPNLKQ